MKFSSRISEEVKDLLNKILQIKPSNRISIDGILEHPWVKRYSKLQRLKEPLNKQDKKDNIHTLKQKISKD